MQERDNVIRILQETKEAFRKGDSATVKKLSDQTINTASRTQDADNIAVAVVVYSLGKVLERERYQEYPGWKDFEKNVNLSLDVAIKNLKKGDFEGTRKDIESIRRFIGKISGKLRKNIQEVFRRSQISKASRIYEHGISMERTAKLLGITMWELADYAGSTGISDVKEAKTVQAKERIKMVEDFWR
jgi:hypothetical protein